MSAEWPPPNFIREDHCPNCGRYIDCAAQGTIAGILFPSQRTKPRPGDVTVCLYCYEISEWNHQMRLQLCDEHRLPAQTRLEIAALRKTLKRAREKFGPPRSFRRNDN